MISDPDEQARRRQLARYELFIEGTRRPELRPFLDEISSAAMKSASLILQSAGLDPSVEQVGQLSRLINGLAFSNLTLSADNPGAQHPADLVDRILKTVLG
jgi:Tetracyclin repressor-like, C-terminal domain